MANLNDTLNTIHENLTNEFKEDEDSKIAQELEDFLNAVLFNRSWASKPGNSLEGVLTQGLLKQLQNDSNFINLFKNVGINSYEKGVKGEEAFAQYILKILQSNLDKLETSIDKEIVKKYLKDSSQILVGTDLTTVNIPKQMADIVSQNLKIVNDNNYTRFMLRQGKNDLNTSELQALGEWTGNAKKLISFTASIKNYNSFVIKLEQLNHQKAYLAIIPNLKDVTESEAINLYRQYYVTKELKADPDVSAHLEHVAKIYALTGYGQVGFGQDGKLIEQQYSRFLMYNNASAQVIKIRSTKQIVSNELSTNFSFGSRGKVKYHI